MEFDEAALGTAILEGPDAVLAADRDGILRFWNSGAERVFGFPRAEAVGRSLDLIIPERLGPRHWEGWFRVAQTGHSRHGSGDLLAVPALHADGHTLSVESRFTSSPITHRGAAERVDQFGLPLRRGRQPARMTSPPHTVTRELAQRHRVSAGRLAYRGRRNRPCRRHLER